ncbi:MAG: DNA repair protein RadA/Sms, partial [Cyclobacteriaceae bacterium]
MAKVKSSFFCQSCGAQSPKWIGKCPSCNEWNTYVEEIVGKKDKSVEQWRDTTVGGRSAKPVRLNEIAQEKMVRVVAKDQELNRVLGGGIVPGSIVLIGGEPGIGKSTLLLQLALSQPDLKVLYVSGEESPQQIKLRADRMEFSSDNCFLLAETSLENIFQQINQLKPAILIIDSIQTLQ